MKREKIIYQILRETFEDEYHDQLKILDPRERQQIIDTIKSIDRIIQLQAEKLETLKQHRLGLIQKLVPDSNGKRGLRFPGFQNN